MPYGDAGPDILLFMIFASSFTGYWASVRFVSSLELLPRFLEQPHKLRVQVLNR